MAALVRLIERLTIGVGMAAAWAVAAMVVLQFAIVLMRAVFGLGSIWAQEAVLYLHGALMLLTAAYALAVDAHVRVDVFYRDASPRLRALVDLVGAVLFLLPMMAVIFSEALPYVARSWAVLEGSRETSGLPAVFLLKSVILVFAVLMLLQGVALVLRAIAVLRSGISAAS